MLPQVIKTSFPPTELKINIMYIMYDKQMNDNLNENYQVEI